MDIQSNNHKLLHFDKYQCIVVDRNFLVLLIHVYERMYVVDELDILLSVSEASVMIVINRLMNELNEDSLKKR